VVNESDTNRPYAPPSNLISVLKRLRSRNLPEEIDVEYLRDAAVPEGTVSRTLFAIRFLGLIDEHGRPSQALRTVHTATDEEYQATLSGLVRDAYGEVFSVVDPAEEDQTRILNIFRRYTPASQRNRMVIFFLGLCREAGIPTRDTPRHRGMNESRVSSPAPTRRRKALDQHQTRAGEGGSRATPALAGLIGSLPPAGSPLSAARRQQWLDMAEATLRFVYPEDNDKEGPTNDGDAADE